MAEITPTFLFRNQIGNKVEDYGSFTLSGDTGGHVKMRMSSVDFCEIATPEGQSNPDSEITITLNTDDGTEDGSVPGAVNFENGTDGETIYFRAIGRG